jgi:hypothetical protein
MTNPIFAITDEKCPTCGSSLYQKRACGSFTKKGYKQILKCPKSGCLYMRGIEEGG